MSSWQSHLDKLVSSGHFDGVAFVDAKDGKELATSDDFKVSPEEGKRVAGELADDAEQKREVQVNGDKYTVMQKSGGAIYGRLGFKGCVAYKAGDAILLGVFPGGKNKDARLAVDSLANDLK